MLTCRRSLNLIERIRTDLPHPGPPGGRAGTGFKNWGPTFSPHKKCGGWVEKKTGERARNGLGARPRIFTCLVHGFVQSLLDISFRIVLVRIRISESVPLLDSPHRSGKMCCTSKKNTKVYCFCADKLAMEGGSEMKHLFCVWIFSVYGLVSAIAAPGGGQPTTFYLCNTETVLCTINNHNFVPKPFEPCSIQVTSGSSEPPHQRAETALRRSCSRRHGTFGGHINSCTEQSGDRPATIICAHVQWSR